MTSSAEAGTDAHRNWPRYTSPGRSWGVDMTVEEGL